MLTLLYARAGQEIRRELLERLGTSPAQRRLLLVPEQYSHESERAMCQVLGNGASRTCEVLSFTRLAGRLREVAGGGAAPVLDGGGRMLLMYAALRQCAPQLRIYRSPSRKPAFLTHVLATIDECKSCCVQPQQLLEAGEELGGQQGDKWRDIGLLYAAYEALAAQGAADPRNRLDVLAQQLTETGWAQGKEIAVFGFTDFTPQEEQVLEQLIHQAHVTVALVCDPDNDPEGIFEPALRAASRLKRLARRGGAGVEEQTLHRPQPSHPALTWMEGHLYGPLPDPWTAECPVTLAQAATPRQEVEWAASEIVALLRRGDVRCRDIVVCPRRLEGYGELVESVFAQYGIPVYLSAMEDVLRHPVLALVTSALAAAAQDYPYEELFRYLKTDLTPLTQDQRDTLENYVLTWNIKGSLWTRKKPWNMHPQGYGLPFSEEDTALVQRLDALRRQVIAPLERMRKCSDQTGAGRAQALYQVLEDIDLPKRLEERAASLERRGDLNTAAQYRQLWDIVVGGLEQCALLLGDTQLEMEEFARLFALVLSQYDVGAIPVSLDRVTVGEAPRMAHKECKYLFFLGADSTAIPSCAPAAGLFSDQDRDALAALEVELASRQEEQLRRELTIVYETCARPTQGLFVSYAQQDGAGQERGPSFLYERLTQLFPAARHGDPADVSCRLAAPGPALEAAGRVGQVRTALSQLPDMRDRVQRLQEAGQWRRGRLSPQGVRTLYGKAVPMSATRLDLYQSCHFCHFLRFGLKAQPRKRAKFAPSDYGTFVHAVLEEVLGQHPAPEQCRALAKEAADRYETEVLQGLEDETARFRWLFDRMKQSVLTVVDSVAGELSASRFVPVWLELGFGKGEQLPPVEVEQDGITLRLSGFVDRVDSWEHEGKRYLRVVDYKTGKKAFDFAEVEDGRGLQMLLYLFALSRNGEALFGDQTLIPAGVLYVPARTALVDGSRNTDPQAVAQEQEKQLRRQGLVLDDPAVIDAMEEAPDGKYRYLPINSRNRDCLVNAEQMQELDEYVTQVLRQAASQVAVGNIDADPYWRDAQHNACQWCEFRSACHFEECLGDTLRRRRSKRAVEFWNWMKDRMGGGDHGN